MNKSGDVRIGISGWRYAGWRDNFYPKDLKHADELQYASTRLQTIEINGTHYSLQSLDSWQRWCAQTPAGFVFGVKGARYLTHLLRFRDDSARAGIANFFAQGLLALDDKLGPILWQFPPSFRFDPDRMERFLNVLPPDTAAALSLAEQHDARVKTPYLKIERKRALRHAVEVRHQSFVDPAFVALLRRYGVALVVSDSTEPWPIVEDLTADFVYIRLHGSEAKYAGSYSDDALRQWAERIEAWRRGSQPDDARLIAPEHAPRRRATRDVYCYFDNDVKARAPFDAQRLMEQLGLHAQPATSKI
ncbi:DUF72 domain-containing protein [Paraburkholderia sp. MMS20-SJTR3]|uniref:DUF72 domain-containing protein n=1 Tax=Paraburkholderia sejongensis TaxID=2886946 RepID=A0ABS8K1X7_9BURK|nr:DUF72 domain-containing protein [Paraburkholderia sp. MMS20-SJTR3]MCC8396151.1 DUF72 domain-containing protein [Paraburkholderia sp. MMS20-SJTR3]